MSYAKYPKEKGVYELELFCEEYSLKEVYPVCSIVNI